MTGVSLKITSAMESSYTGLNPQKHVAFPEEGSTLVVGVMHMRLQ